MSFRTPLSNMGMQFSQDFNNHDHLNKEYCFRTSSATHLYPAFIGQLLFSNSSGGSSLISVVVSIGILPSPPNWHVLPLMDWLLLSPPERSLPLPGLDKDALSLTLDIPVLNNKMTVETRNISDRSRANRWLPSNLLRMNKSKFIS